MKGYGQTRLESFIETCVNIAVGLSLSLLGNIIYLGVYLGMPIPWEHYGGLASFMTIISIVRSYSLRRLFNWIYLRRLTHG